MPHDDNDLHDKHSGDGEDLPEPTFAPPRFDDLPDMVSPEQARQFLQVSRNGIYLLIEENKIASVRFGRLIRIPKNALVGRAG